MLAARAGRSSTSTAWSLRWQRDVHPPRLRGQHRLLAEHATRPRPAAAAMSSRDDQPQLQRRAARPTDLSSSEVPSATLTAAVDHRDPVGELVGLVEVLRGEQDRAAVARPARGWWSHIWPRVRGSRPVVGSSRKISGGRRDQAGGEVEPAAHAAGELRDRLVGRLLEPELLEQVQPAVARASARRRPWRRPKSHQVLGGGQVLVDRGVLAGDAEELADDVRAACARRCRRSAALARRRSGSRVASILSMVVLPAPLGPRTPKTSPRCTVEVDAVDGAHARRSS